MPWPLRCGIELIWMGRGGMVTTFQGLTGGDRHSRSNHRVHELFKTEESNTYFVARFPLGMGYSRRYLRSNLNGLDEAAFRLLASSVPSFLPLTFEIAFACSSARARSRPRVDEQKGGRQG